MESEEVETEVGCEEVRKIEEGVDPGLSWFVH